MRTSTRARLAQHLHWLRTSVVARLTGLMLLIVGLSLIMAGMITAPIVRQATLDVARHEVATIHRASLEQARQFLTTHEDEVAILSSSPRLLHPDPAILTAYFRLVQRTRGSFTFMAFMDPTGQVVAATDLGRAAELARDPASRAGLRGPSVSDARPGLGHPERPVLLYSHPVRNPRGALVGALAAEVDLDDLLRTMIRGRAHQSGETYLLRADGRFITPSRFLAEPPLRRPISTRGYREARAGHTGLGTYRDYRGQEVIGAYAPLQVSARLATSPRWSLLSELDLAEATAPVQALTRAIAGLMAWLLVLFALLIALINRQVSQPLRRLRDTAERIAAGRWDQRVQVHGQDEFGQLGTTFNHMAAEIEHYITERRLLEQTLREQYTRLEQLDRIKTDFVSAITHDLRSPLTSIFGYAELLTEGQGGPLNERQRDYAAQIDRSAVRMAHMVDDLLDFARIDAGTFHLDYETFDLVTELEDLIRSLRPQLADAALHLDLDLPTTLPLEGDPERLTRVFTNLLTNAIKFTPRGGHLRLSVQLDAGWVHAEVQDSGVGLAADDLPRLFLRFSQLERGRQQKGGTGLGLSICKALIEAHGGMIGASSQPGQGATFWCRIPRARPPAEGVRGSESGPPPRPPSRT